MNHPEEGSPPAATTVPSVAAELRPAIPYALPLAVYMLTGGGESWLVEHLGQTRPWLYPALYAGRLALTAAIAWACRSTWVDFKPWPRPAATALAVAAGLLVTVLWVGLDGHYPAIPLLGARVAFDPQRLGGAPRSAFILVRLVGLVALVPIIEELFWRSLVMRWVVNPDFRTVPIGTVTLTAAVVSSLFFATAHPEWLPAILTGLIWAALLAKTGSLFACVVSHAIANLALAAYVLATGSWKYW